MNLKLLYPKFLDNTKISIYEVDGYKSNGEYNIIKEVKTKCNFVKKYIEKKDKEGNILIINGIATIGDKKAIKELINMKRGFAKIDGEEYQIESITKNKNTVGEVFFITLELMQ